MKWGSVAKQGDTRILKKYAVVIGKVNILWSLT